MHGDDLIAYLQPAPNRFDPNEWRDVTGSITEIRVEPHRFTMQANLPPGLYRCRLETKAGAFDMATARLAMLRVPDGQRVLVGPWELDHFHHVMALPMARALVNGKLKGGLWFAKPGPQQIAEGRLGADFGFEAEADRTELTLELIERDRQRLDWSRVQFMEFRRDNRSLCPLLPANHRRPRVYLNANEVEPLRRRLLSDPLFLAKVDELKRGGLDFGIETGGNVDLACLAHLLTGDGELGVKAKDKIVELCRLPTWSGQPDPLVMGGDNDRSVGRRLYFTGIAWDWLAPLFAGEERRVVLAKAEEYLQKMYDFTVLQRAYMGCPATDPHALGSWNGAGVACLAFYDDLAIARKALPFFHGLFVDSLQVFPPGGKTVWATTFPFYLARYLAAAHTFGGPRPELSQSPFLDNLGRALLACFETPNTQEQQRGRRTRDHRYLSAFLCRFHPTAGIESIYRAFVERERELAGNVELGLFDFLYAPSQSALPAPFPKSPWFAKDTGTLFFVSRGKKTISGAFSAGIKAGSQASFRLLPHYRDFPLSMGDLEVSVDGAPVLVNINMGTYGLNSALTNTMCFDPVSDAGSDAARDGGALTNGQSSNGDVGPEQSAYIRRCFINDRFLYAHAVITETLHPRLEVRRADRILIADYRHAVMLLADSFEGNKPIRFATHLHCSGSVTDLGDGRYRLTGGQANLIAGRKGGSKGLSDEERGEIFVTVLGNGAPHRVVVEEAAWVPAYIYGLNRTGKEELSDGRFPHYRRWRLEYPQPVRAGSFLVGLSGEPVGLRVENDRVTLAQGAYIQFADGRPIHALGCDCVAEAVLADPTAGRVVLIGARRFTTKKREAAFAASTDVELTMADGCECGSNQCSVTDH